MVKECTYSTVVYAIVVCSYSRLQNDLAALTRDYKENARALECSRQEVEDLKLQLQGYVAEARRVNQMLEEKVIHYKMFLK